MLRSAWTGPSGRFPALVMAGLALLCMATAAPAAAWPAGHRALGHGDRVFTGSDLLVAVAATSASNAWAVGDYFVSGGGGKQLPLVEHWTGGKWRVVATPAVGGKAAGYLLGVAALSARNAWAVGAEHGRALIEHWNGSAWRVMAGAAVRGRNVSTGLAGVAALSAKSIWAVGSVSTARGLIPLIEHWNGVRWARVPSPDPGGLSANDYLTGVAASKAGVWAVGTSAPHNVYRTVVLALAGGRWRQLRSPNPSGLGNWLGAVSASGNRVLGAGFGGYDNPVAAQTLVMHRSGPAFRLDATPNPGGTGAQDELYGVAATPSGGWAVGRSAAQTLILREQSGVWSQVTSPSWPSPATSILEGVAAWRNTAWAVGQYNIAVGSISVSYSLILRWTGTTWAQVPSPNR